ncbi:hypothetical protein ES703_105455 [subsurface metagenome]
MFVIICLAFHLCGVIAYLLKHVEQGEDMHIRYGLFISLKGIDQPLSPRGNGIPIKFYLIVTKAAGPDVLDLLRKLIQDRLFQSAQCERGYESAQRLLSGAGRIRFNGLDIPFMEVLVGSQVPWNSQVEKGLELP